MPLQCNLLDMCSTISSSLYFPVSFLHDLQAVTHMLHSLETLSTISGDSNTALTGDEHLLRGSPAESGKILTVKFPSVGFIVITLDCIIWIFMMDSEHAVVPSKSLILLCALSHPLNEYYLSLQSLAGMWAVGLNCIVDILCSVSPDVTLLMDEFESAGGRKLFVHILAGEMNFLIYSNIISPVPLYIGTHAMFPMDICMYLLFAVIVHIFRGQSKQMQQTVLRLSITPSFHHIFQSPHTSTFPLIPLTVPLHAMHSLSIYRLNT